ncbi:MAG: miaA, partial [Acidimicrobiia bacterium]|nr:miaA [Acidimicrobiia bacterium]
MTPSTAVVLAIVGSTASGKSALAMELASELGNAEILSVDSMQVYRHMDIGTAKPTAAERRQVRHHLIDLAEPSEEVTVVRFRRHYDEALADIAARGRRAIVVGGTGLYLRAVLDRLEPPGQWPELRAELAANDDLDSLHRRLRDLDPTAAAKIEPSNRRRLVRALEVCLGSGQPFSSFGPGLESYTPIDIPQVALSWPRPELGERIVARVRQQLADGWLDEARWLSTQSLSRSARKALGYAELFEHLAGGLSLDAAVDRIALRTRQFAVRQERW